MNILKGVQNRLNGSGGGGGSDEKPPEGSDPDDTSVLDEKEGSIVMSLISQLRIGMDLSKIAFPTFVLEPRSMLERITDFMAYSELLFGLENQPEARERFVTVLQYYMCGWHIKPKGVKKPYNPVLGEIFRCRLKYSNGTEGYYVAEQVSHHPPVSAYFFVSPANKLLITGELRPKSRFLGNSVQTLMDGENRVTLLGKPQDGEYVITMPNMFARGILFGKLVFELGDTITATNEKNSLVAEVEFKTKGFFSGTYNAVKGDVKQGGSSVGEVSGKWNHILEYKDAKTGQNRVFFNSENAEKIPQTVVVPEQEQEPNESRRLWSQVTAGILSGDQTSAADAKAALEDNGRKYAKSLETSKKTHVARFFEKKGSGWVAKFQLPADPVQAEAEVQKWIWAPAPA